MILAHRIALDPTPGQRDLNAAFNLKKKAAGLAVTARGEDVRPKALPDADLCEARTGGVTKSTCRQQKKAAIMKHGEPT